MTLQAAYHGVAISAGATVTDFLGVSRKFGGITRAASPGRSAKILLDGAEYYAHVVPGLAVTEVTRELIVPADRAALLRELLDTAMLLTEPGEPNPEYVRGQANLIADVCGLGGVRQDSDEVTANLIAAIAGAPVRLVPETAGPLA
jgi:hypothetical protein